MSARRPTVVTSDSAAEHVAAALHDYAHRITAEPHNAPTASLARLCRRTARELLDLHEIDPREVLIDPPTDRTEN
jgi:hypothetical protein